MLHFAALLFFALCVLSCGGSQRTPRDQIEPEPVNPREDGPSPAPKLQRTPSAEEVAGVEIPALFVYELTAYTRSAHGNLKMYVLRIDQNGNAELRTFPREGNRNAASSVNVKVSAAQLRTIVYYYQKVDFGDLRSNYSQYDARNCDYDAERGPHLYELRIASNGGPNSVRLLEFCNDKSGDIEDVERLVKMAAIASELKPHLEKAVRDF